MYAGVIALYVSVNYICVRALGAAGLANTTTPASAVMRMALGQRGATWIAAGYRDFRARISQPVHPHRAARLFCDGRRRRVFSAASHGSAPRTRVPVVAIALQGVWAIVIALSGRYEQILNFVVSSMDLIFFGLSGLCIFIFHMARKRAAIISRRKRHLSRPRSSVHHGRVHLRVVWIVVAATFYHYPKDSLIGLGIALAGLPIYFLWGARNNKQLHKG